MKTPRRSRMLDNMRSGKPVLGFKLNTSCHRPVEIAAYAGFDAVWLCREHTPGDWGRLEAQILAANLHDIDSIVRVPKGCYSDYLLPLEANATAIMVPHLMSLEEARQTVRQTRFHPVGLRPWDGGNADGMYCRLSAAEYFELANHNRLVIVQIEDPEPLAELDEICALDGIDMIFFGPGDFSQAIGHPGEFDHPEIHRVRRLIAETARKHGKFAGTVSRPDTMKEYLEMGYMFLNCGADVIGLNNYCDNIAGTFAALRQS